MTNNRKFALLILVLFASLSCSLIKKDGNFLGVSRSSKDSKKHDLFVKELSLNGKLIRLENHKIRVKEVFIEKKWRSDSEGRIKPTRGYNLVILCKERLPSGYSSNWMLGLTPNKLFNTLDGKLLVVDVSQDWVNKDLIEVTIYQGDVAQHKSNPDEVRKKTIELE